MSRRPRLLAIDAGGSKVDAALLRADGRLVGAARVANTDHDGTGSDRHMESALEAVRAACLDAGVDPDVLPVADLGIYCVAGADLPQDDRRIGRWLARRKVTAEDVVRNDTFAVLRAGTDRPWGVSIVCGYGINCCAVSPEGRTYRFPAVGPISGDWGGGSDIGGTALWYAIRAEDGRGEPTSLRTLVPAHLGMRRPRQVLEALYFGRMQERDLIHLPPTVFTAAREGDAVARSIVDRQADEVVALARASIRKLRMTDLDVEVVLGGGIFRNDDPAFFERVTQGICAAAPGAQIHVLHAPPVVGAALLGLDRIGAGRAAHARVRQALTHQRLGDDTHARPRGGT
ncbi:MAG: ATPase [Actinobacteria bacterium]|nr:ATPase [Actinomycetota bacterium]